jgi:hypothetical protein
MTYIPQSQFEFPALVVQQAYFKESTVRKIRPSEATFTDVSSRQTILVRLADHTIWQSSNEGYTWTQLLPGERFLAFYHHSYTPDRAYLITNTRKFYYTTDTGRSWYPLTAPSVPNTFRAQVLRFHPRSDYLIWTGDEECTGAGENCHAEAQYSTDNGRRWTPIESYIRNCAWAKDAELNIDPTQILCESYRDKTGSQRLFQFGNPLELVGGTAFFTKKTKLFDYVVGFAKFSEFLIVAEVSCG